MAKPPSRRRNITLRVAAATGAAVVLVPQWTAAQLPEPRPKAPYSVERAPPNYDPTDDIERALRSLEQRIAATRDEEASTLRNIMMRLQRMQGTVIEIFTLIDGIPLPPPTPLKQLQPTPGAAPTARAPAPAAPVPIAPAPVVPTPGTVPPAPEPAPAPPAPLPAPAPSAPPSPPSAAPEPPVGAPKPETPTTLPRLPLAPPVAAVPAPAAAEIPWTLVAAGGASLALLGLLLAKRRRRKDLALGNFDDAFADRPTGAVAAPIEAPPPRPATPPSPPPPRLPPHPQPAPKPAPPPQPAAAPMRAAMPGRPPSPAPLRPSRPVAPPPPPPGISNAIRNATVALDAKLEAVPASLDLPLNFSSTPPPPPAAPPVMTAAPVPKPKPKPQPIGTPPGQQDQALELADVMISMGLAESASQTLVEHIRANPRRALHYWHKLLDIYRASGKQEHFEKSANQLRENFNIQTDDWQAVMEGDTRSIADYDHLMARIQELWRQPGCEDFLAELLEDNRGGTRAGFPLSVAGDIMLLIAILNDT